MNSYRQSQFDNIESKDVRKSKFDLAHEVKTQMCFGRYYPVEVFEVMPGDELEIDAEYMFRFPSLYFPIQQIGTMRADWFYCPYSILFRGEFGTNYNKTGWKGFYQGEPITLPRTLLNINGNPLDGQETIYEGCSYPVENYMGFPMDITDRIDASKQWHVEGLAFALSMYLMSYDEWYMNPLWEEPVFFNLSENAGTNHTNFNGVVQVVNGKEYADWDSQALGGGKFKINHPPFFAHYPKDYFTSARPEPQDGDPIRIPMVEDDTELVGEYPSKWVDEDGVPVAISENLVTVGGDGKTITATTATPVGLKLDATIKKLRLYQVLQQFHERAMRSLVGNYRKYVKGMNGVDPEPSVIDIPQLIGSHFGRLQISDTMTTADTTEANTGNYRGNVHFHNNGTKHRYFVQDWGLVMCIVNVMPNTAYSQGIHPMWMREVNTDYALDMFSGIGDQEILKRELHVLNVANLWTSEAEKVPISYQDRFAEYKTIPNRIFNTKEIYKSFYMGQMLTELEADYDEIDGGSIIIAGSYPVTDGLRERDIFNVLPIKDGASTYSDATIYAHMYFDIQVKRPLPYFSVPGKMIM